MGYRLSIDLGTTFTTAAVSREGALGVWGPPEVIALSDHGAAIPTVLYLGPAGETVIGTAAIRRAVTDPDRVVRQVKSRIGDETPIVTGPGGALAAHEVGARFIAAVADVVAVREGGPPDAIAVTHPASWGLHKKDLLRVALAREGLTGVHLVPEPEAAALAYARTGRLRAGSTLAIYDLGGGTFDTALLRAEPDGRFTLLGRPVGIGDLGGVDFDDEVLAHVLGALGTNAAELAAMELSTADAGALAALRRECVEAKEALSADTVAVIPVALAGTAVRLTRAEFEALVVDRLAETLAAIGTALESAGLEPGDLDRILLVGGSARIPVITQLLSARFPAASIERDIDPKLAVVTGAVLALDPLPAAPFLPAAILVACQIDDLGPARPAVVAELDWAPAAACLAGIEGDDEDTVEHSAIPAPRRRRVPLGLAALALVVGGGAGAVVFEGDPSAEAEKAPTVRLEVAPLPGAAGKNSRPSDAAETADRDPAAGTPRTASVSRPRAASSSGSSASSTDSSTSTSTTVAATTTRSAAATRNAVAPAPRPVTRPVNRPVARPPAVREPSTVTKPAPLTRPAAADETGSAEFGVESDTSQSPAQDTDRGSVETTETGAPAPPASPTPGSAPPAG